MNLKNLLPVSFFIIGLLFSGCSSNSERRAGEPRVLVFTKTTGFKHASIPDGVKAVQELGKEHGFKVDTTSISAKFVEDTLKQYSAVIFMSTTGDILNTREQVEFQRYIQAGGGYVGVHGAVDSEYNWPWYGKLIGAYFKNHPAIQEAKLDIHADKKFEITESLPNPWVRTDEWYNFISLPENVNVLVSIDEESYEGGENGEEHPVVWYHEYDGGRGFYMALGHTPESYKDPDFLNLLKAGIDYAIGENNELDYGKATALKVPEENRFSKEILAEGLDEPTELTVLPNLDILIAERKGAIKYYSAGSQTLSVVANMDVYYKALEAKVNVEFGVLGMQADPDFSTNNWIYLYYSPVDKSVDRLSRFKFMNGNFDLDSEQVILEVETTREIFCHTGGSIAFDSNGNLFLSTGDNTTPFDEINPETGKTYPINSHGFAPLDDRPGLENYDARRSSGNSADLRGKIIRIKVNEDGSYSIPEGNLFPKDDPKVRPEIFVMGTRNPYRISVDKKTDYLYWGEVGPDANNDSLATRGPRGYDEINQARKAGNFGWPYFIGKNYPYREYNYKTGESGQAFNPEGPGNNSRNNTGLIELPPGQAAFIEYPYTVSREFPVLGNGGRTSMASPIYHVNDFPEDKRFPQYYDGKFFIYDWVRDWIMAVTMSENGDLEAIEPFMENTVFRAISDMEVGPDGQIYVVEYGKGWYSQNPGAALSVLKYNSGNRPPVVKYTLDQDAEAVPLNIKASAEGTFDPDGDKLKYVWDLGNGSKKKTKDPYIEHTYNESGIYNVSLTVIDEQNTTSRSEEIQVFAGNSRPQINIDVAGNSTFYFPGKAINYNVEVKDPEDGELGPEDLQARGYVKADYLESSDQAALHSSTLQSMAKGLPGKTKIESLDCVACHKADEKSIGPSYKEMAKRYKNNPEAMNFLPQTIIKGGSGNWGQMAMAAHPDLPLSDAKEIVTYILSLANEDIQEKSMPMKGSFIPSEKFQLKPQGDILISASYADKGFNKLPSLTKMENYVLRNPLIKLETGETSSGISNMTMGGKEIKVINEDNSWIKFPQISLYDVNAVQVSYGMRETTGKGWKMEMRLGNPEGELLGEQILGVGVEVRKPSQATLKVLRDVQDTKLQDVYFVFKRIGSEEQASVGIIDLLLEAE
ncbi:ThuA domain-containing protein [Antarcticibacterium sp. 1MA-6-2]|uniref:ThuA domain-containing protein n=1 Tax=Antarcticibacterium sp. 1MA-6-2 TaxID=2908210 RepID=UPI001F2608D2|nr:ThuA domain-containing protein [Antarcticibacterium sp. 1MA-6-2]UJH90812.1 ThuA domain-containing protein [Antarcticibacterium sp. 1MA-6-2]